MSTKQFHTHPWSTAWTRAWCSGTRARIRCGPRATCTWTGSSSSGTRTASAGAGCPRSWGTRKSIGRWLGSARRSPGCWRTARSTGRSTAWTRRPSAGLVPLAGPSGRWAAQRQRPPAPASAHPGISGGCWTHTTCTGPTGPPRAKRSRRTRAIITASARGIVIDTF